MIYNEILKLRKTFVIRFVNTLLFVFIFQIEYGYSKVPKASLINSTKNSKFFWVKKDGKYFIDKIEFSKINKTLTINVDKGLISYSYSREKPKIVADSSAKKQFSKIFIEGIDKHQQSEFNSVLNNVALNLENNHYYVNPDSIILNKNKVTLIFKTAHGRLISNWDIVDIESGIELRVNSILESDKEGYVSITSPRLIHTSTENLKWGVIPGYFQGNYINNNFINAYAYGMGIPDKPVIYQERTAATLASIIERKDGFTIAAAAEPGSARDPWEYDIYTHRKWHIGLGIKSTDDYLLPIVYDPILGSERSDLGLKKQVASNSRIIIKHRDWFNTLKYVINDVYNFRTSLDLKYNNNSLVARLDNLVKYLENDTLSSWRVEDHEGLKIGAHSYLGPVIDSKKDAMKNSDYGAMWLIGNKASNKIKNKYLPYARNFKIAQQESDPGYFYGSPKGQYYLSKSDKFVEEWARVVEPMGVTYYSIIDIGNILLFNPDDTELYDKLKVSADLLLKWQKPDGSWEIAYDKLNETPLFKDLNEFRPTFYGLVVAYRILKDQKYLDGAIKGANWFIENSIEKGNFIGVCGDIRYIPDFATIQSSQCLLDLFEVTADNKYKDAAIDVAKIYISSIYTHPISRNLVKEVKGKKVFDWQITQAGLSFEHGGIFGSATTWGPIILTSHAGLFIRIYDLTKETLFLDMARSAVIGRDAFINPETGVASYYWSTMDRGAGPYPHHAWWQIGWIVDYLMAEIEIRSSNKIRFPKGFVTPKVGPHLSYGFQPGKLFDRDVELMFNQGIVKCANPNIEYLILKDIKTNETLLILLNDLKQNQNFTISIDKSVVSNRAKKSKYFKTDDNEVVLKSKIGSYGYQVYNLTELTSLKQ